MTNAPDVALEHEHIQALRAGAAFSEIGVSFLDRYAPIFRRAAWMRARLLGRDDAEFGSRHEKAWLSYLASAAYPATLTNDRWPSELERCLFIGFHFPRWPEVSIGLLARGVTCLVPGALPWLPPELRSGLLPFRSEPIAAARKLRRLFGSGAGIAIMGDHLYEGTHGVDVTLLGRRAVLPLGLLGWARRAGYRISLIHASETGLEVVQLAPDAQAVADALWSQIQASPGEWLQWGSADRVFPTLFETVDA